MMKDIYLVVGQDNESDDEMIQTAWLNESNAKEQAEQSNREQDMVEHRVVSVAIQDSTVLPYIAVYQWGGIINTVSLRTDLQALIKEMNERLIDDFDPDTDDARIFDSQGNEVYSFDYDAALDAQENGDAN